MSTRIYYYSLGLFCIAYSHLTSLSISSQSFLEIDTILDKLNDEQLDIVYKIICQMLPQSPTEDSFHINQTPK